MGGVRGYRISTYWRIKTNYFEKIGKFVDRKNKNMIVYIEVIRNRIKSKYVEL